MTATVEEARDAILTQFKGVWDADVLTAPVAVQYQNVRQAGSTTAFPPTGADADGNATPWARVTIAHNPGAGGEVTLTGGLGTRRYRRIGVVTVQIFGAAGRGLLGVDRMAAVAMRAFEGVDLVPSGVVFRSVRFAEVGPDGAWYNGNVTAEFEYDEVK